MICTILSPSPGSWTPWPSLWKRSRHAAPILQRSQSMALKQRDPNQKISTSCLGYNTTFSDHMIFKKSWFDWTTGCFPIGPLSSQRTHKSKEGKSEGFLGQEVTQDSRRERAQEFESGRRCAFCCISERSHQSTDHRSKGRWEEGVQFDIRLAADSDAAPRKALSTLTLMLYSKTYPEMHHDNFSEK